MTQSPDAPGNPPEPDLEYDLAHEADSAAQRPRPTESDAVTVATQTPDYDGDYSYDLAHDVPRQ
jgi:hypothetical protein